MMKDSFSKHHASEVNEMLSEATSASEGGDFSRKEMARIIHTAYGMCKQYPYLTRIGSISAALVLLISMVLWPARLHTLFPDATSYFSFFSLDGVRELYSVNFGLALTATIVFGVLFLLKMLFPIWAEASIVTSVTHLQKDNELKLGFWRSLWLGMKRVVYLVEYEAVTFVFDLSKLTLLMYALAMLLGVDLVVSLWPVFLIAACFQLLFSTLFVYGKYNAIIQKGEIFKSLQKSMTLVFFYLNETFLLLMILGFFVFIIGLYTVLYFAFPALIVVVLQFFLNSFVSQVTWYIGGAVAAFMFYVFARLIGFAQVLLSTIWTLTFLDLVERKEHKLIDEE